MELWKEGVKHLKYNNFYIIYGLLFLIYIINILFDSSVIHLVISWSAVVTLVMSSFRATNLFRLMGLIFSCAGVYMSLTSGVRWYEIPEQITSTFPMLIFLSVLPWMASAFSIGEYDQNLSKIINSKNNQLPELYGKSLTTTYSLVVFINISAIYIGQQILMKKLSGVKESIRNDFIIKTTLRTFSLAAIWSPMEIIVGITIDATNISFLEYLPWLLLCSFLMAVIDVKFNKDKLPAVEVSDQSNINKSRLVKALAKLFFILFIFFAIIITANNIFETTFILTVSLIILPFTFIWSICMRRTIIFLKYGWKSWKNYNNNLQNFVVLFLSLALFSEGFNKTPMPEILQYVLGQISDYYLLIFIFITLIYFLMGLIGVHPIATIAILIEILNPLFDIINPLSIGLVLII